MNLRATITFLRGHRIPEDVISESSISLSDEANTNAKQALLEVGHALIARCAGRTNVPRDTAQINIVIWEK